MALSTGGALLAACASAAGTSGRRVQLALRVEPGSLTFTNAFGWQLELARVLVSIGPLAYLEGAPVAMRAMPWRALAQARRALGVAVAHAHPGHYHAGGTLAEALVATSVDLALGPVELGVAAGVSGTALSGRFSFQAPPLGPYARDLGSHVACVEGEAKKDGTALPFRVVAGVEDVLDPQGRPEVLGCAFHDGAIEANGTVSLTVAPSIWLDQCDFAGLVASGDRQPVELDRSLGAHQSFLRGLRKAASYVFTYVARAER